jgi:hypothetical protein
MKNRKRIVAPHGQKMIELTVRFWTNNISKKKGYVVKREAWDSGTLYLHQNDAHGIRASGALQFYSLLDLPAKIEALITHNGIKLHRGKRSRKYIAD